MKHLKVTSSRSYKHGFVLKESELRRLISLSTEQFKKLSDDTPIYEFDLKFKNGAVAKTIEIDDVFGQQNDASDLIVKLEVTGTIDTPQGKSQIHYVFKNIALEDDDHIPVRHRIESNDKDWVFVTSSLIEERVSKIKRFEVANIDKRHPLWVRFIPILGVYIVLLISVLQITINANIDNRNRLQFLNQIEADWKNGKMKDPIELIIKMEKNESKILSGNNRSPSDKVVSMIFNKYMIVFILIVAGTFMTFWVSSKVYPSYNFVWGGYIEEFDRKESVTKFIISFVFIGILLSIIINVFSSYLWEFLH